MSARDLPLFARTRIQLEQALADARLRNDPAMISRIETQLNQHPYNRADVIDQTARFRRAQQPNPEPPTVIERVRGEK
jgi:hypothetical protein